VVLEVDEQLPSLDEFRYHRLLKAENGRCGGANQSQGRTGRDRIVKVPCGTLIKDPETGEVLHDLTDAGQRIVLCKGGRGGRGNASFKSPTNRAPTKATEGTPGEQCELELELKLIADVGLVGFPNAGKSTLISALSKVHVRIAPYPFTTLQPNLGYIEFDDFSRVLIADIPGIIGGAHQNRGLGHEFLRHIERTKVLIYVVDASGIDGRSAAEDLKVLRDELGKYNPEMLDKPYLVALNKVDVEGIEEQIKEFHAQYDLDPSRLIQISAQEGLHLAEFREAMRALAQAEGKRF
jgi:GTP-binding protein